MEGKHSARIDLRNRIARRVAALRILKGHSPEELAARAGVVVSYLLAIEAAQQVDLFLLHRIAEALDVNTADLMDPRDWVVEKRIHLGVGRGQG